MTLDILKFLLEFILKAKKIERINFAVQQSNFIFFHLPKTLKYILKWHEQKRLMKKFGSFKFISEVTKFRKLDHIQIFAK